MAAVSEAQPRDSIGIASNNDSISSTRGRSFREAVSFHKRLRSRSLRSQRDNSISRKVSPDSEIPRLPSYQSMGAFDTTSFPHSSDSNSPPPTTKPFSKAFYPHRPMDRTISGSQGVPVPPIPENSPTSTAQGSQAFDPYARSESMTNRGRYSYASSAVHTTDSPRRVRRRKDPTPFK